MKNPVDAVINFFAPQLGMKRARARLATRSYEAATSGRRTSSFRGMPFSANAEISLALRPLRDRARELVRNTPHAQRALTILATSTIGSGIIPVSKTGNDSLDKRVDQLWADWNAKADVEGVLSFYAQQVVGMRALVESGEVVFRFIDIEPKNAEGTVPFRLQMLEADFIDQWREGIYDSPGSEGGKGLANTVRSRLGVGLGEFDKRTGLWLFPWHPGEVNTYNMRPGISQFIPADEVIHLYRPQRPGQVRGVSWFANVLMTARDLADFLDAVLVKARVEACFSAFIKNSDEFESVMDPSPAYLSAQDASNPSAIPTTLEPGMIKELKSGQDISFAQPTSATQLEPMLLFNLMSFAAGIDCTYDQLSGDLRHANYSSLRAGKIDFRRSIEQIQNLFVIPMFCERVWERFIDRAILAGMLPKNKKYPCEWVTPAWEAVDPSKDLDAELKSVRAFRQSPQQFIASWGSNWRTILKDWKEFTDELDKLELKTDLDPRFLDLTGKAQKPAPDPSETSPVPDPAAADPTDKPKQNPPLDEPAKP